jgi:hypothetical protein
MSSGTSITIERTFLSANASWPVHLKPWKEPSASAKNGSLRTPMNSRTWPAMTGAALRVAVAVDVDPVDPVGVEIRSHQERRHRAHARRERVHVDDDHRLAGLGGRKDPQVGEVQARVIARELEVGRAVVVRHAGSLR